MASKKEVSIQDKEKQIKVSVAASASAVNFVLGIFKFYAGLFTNSISIISDGIHSFGDVFSNAGAAIGFAVENKKPTEKYPSGFGRVEYVMTFVMAIIVVCLGGYFAYCALDRLFYRQIVTFAWLQFWIVFGTILVKVVMAVVFALLYKKMPSDVLKAQKLDCILDSLITTFALLGLFLYRYISFPVDAVIGLVISAVLLVSGIKLLIEGFRKLMCSRDNYRSDGLIRLSRIQEGVREVMVKVYDFGRHYADANIGLLFEEDVSLERQKEIKEIIASKASEKAIKVYFVDYEPPAVLFQEENTDEKLVLDDNSAKEDKE